ncbi:ABC transporter substrate-binding protein [Paenibacillus humicola]|uniref:ABC transporter substrate-binding protein n=1 Tax=Paenibacillus humicola TaxID=3110540 RepID=UPI00237B5DC2|nr:extracellular solute-binding protein [Paenibacillus humicola]
MRRTCVFLPVLFVLLIGLAACSNGKEAVNGGSDPGQAASGAVKTLKLFTNSPEMVDTLNAYTKEFERKMPGYTVEVTAIPGVEAYNTAMTAKLAAGDPPDIFIYQWGTQIQLYAKGGHLLDLSGKGFEDKLKPIHKKLNVYQWKTYALPIQQTVWGMYFNADLAKKYGVNEMPKTFSEFLAACETLKKNGLETPIVIPAKDASGANAFNFGYLHLVISGQNPDFYKETVEGTKHWNGPEMRGLFDAYGKVLKYANKDLLGLDPDGARRRYANEEAVFYMAGTPDSVAIRQLNPNINFIIAPYPLLENESDYKTIADFDSAVSVSSKTKYPDAAVAYLNEMFTVDSGNLFAKNLNEISAVKGTSGNIDKSLENEVPLLDSGKYVGFSEREWIPGIKDIMKKATQQWMAGEDVNQVLDTMEKEHQRLLNASPDFKKDFMDLHVETQ